MSKSCEKHNNQPKTNAHNFSNLTDAIYKCGLTNTELAKRVGVHKSRITAWLKEEDFPSEKSLQKLLEILNEIQIRNSLELYTIEYLRGDHTCMSIENEEIYNRIKLKDNAIDTLIKIAEKDIEPYSLIPIDPYNHFTYMGTANYVISQMELWETFYAETRKVLKEIRQHYGMEYYQNVINSLDVYNSAELNKTIHNIFNNYIKEMLKYYFPKE